MPRYDVLLVEDDRVSAAVTMDRLIEFDDPGGTSFGCVHVETLCEALKQLGQRRFDAVISDLGLPDSGGVRTIIALRACAADVPIITLTADSALNTMNKSVEAGGDGYLVKGEGGSMALARTIVLAIERRKSLTRLRRSEAMSRAVVNCAGDAIITVNEHQVLLSFNHAAERLFGYQAGEIIGKHVAVLVPPRLRDQHDKHFRAFLTDESRHLKLLQREIEVLHKQGRTFPAELVVTELVGYDVCRCFCAIVRDLTDLSMCDARVSKLTTALQDRNAELTAALREAQAAARAKCEFLANMSHEIRTPMTAILGYADLLLEDGEIANAPSRRVEEIKTIQENGRQLLNVISHILDLSKCEAGTLVAKYVPCSPAAIVDEVRSLMRIRASEKGLGFDIEYAGPIPQSISTDPVRLRQILLNLLGNAIKFTESGGVRLIVRLRTGGTSTMEFDVLDTGIGMTPEQQSRLFQPFMQADSSMSRRFGGIGLGLTVCKNLARILGGDLYLVESALGAGTRFRLTVATGPLDKVEWVPPGRQVVADGSPTFPPQPSESASPLTGCRVLIAEDGPDNQRLISCLLRTAGAEVEIAENGQLAVGAALRAINDERAFNIILMDMQMPVLDGYGATELLRKNGYRGAIIAVTAHALTGDREKCLAAGCDDYATKPIEKNKLIAMIASRFAAAQSPVTVA